MLLTLLILSGNIFCVSPICIGDYRTRHSSQAISVIILIIMKLYLNFTSNYSSSYRKFMDPDPGPGLPDGLYSAQMKTDVFCTYEAQTEP